VGETDRRPLLAVIPFNVDAMAVLPLVADLRRAGVRVELELRGRKIGKALGWADSVGCTHAMIVGPNELDDKKAKVKHLASGEQTEVGLSTVDVLEGLQRSSA